MLRKKDVNFFSKVLAFFRVIAYNNTIRLNSWDKTRIPLPFSKSVVHIGKPLFINPSISIDEGCKILKSYMFECENLAVQKLKAGC